MTLTAGTRIGPYEILFPLVIWGKAIPFWDAVRTHPQFEEVTREVWG